MSQTWFCFGPVQLVLWRVLTACTWGLSLGVHLEWHWPFMHVQLKPLKRGQLRLSQVYRRGVWPLLGQFAKKRPEGNFHCSLEERWSAGEAGEIPVPLSSNCWRPMIFTRKNLVVGNNPIDCWFANSPIRQYSYLHSPDEKMRHGEGARLARGHTPRKPELQDSKCHLHLFC